MGRTGGDASPLMVCQHGVPRDRQADSRLTDRDSQPSFRKLLAADRGLIEGTAETAIFKRHAVNKS